MRLLLIHADRFAFRVTGTSTAARTTTVDPGQATGEFDAVLVGFVTAEAGDERGPDDIVTQAVAEITQTAETIGARRVMIYPYAHLSSDLARPRFASTTIQTIANRLTESTDLEVRQAAFGHYKAFEIVAKGHPMSERAVTLTPREASRPVATPDGSDALESAALAAERTLRSEWRVYAPDGSFVTAESYGFADDARLRGLYAYERDGTRAAEEAPPHIRLMRDHQLVDYEPASDTGNLRWYPKGVVMKRLLEQHVTGLVAEYGAMEVETPIMYDYGHPALAKYLQRFPARQYLVKSDDKDLFLRFAACFGQYMIAHDMVTSHHHLPVRLFELTHFSFRREQGGEVTGLRRLRAFTMPDMHTVVADTAMAKEEFLDQVRLCLRWLDDLDLDCVPAIRFVQSFLDDNPGFVHDLMAVLGRPALVEVWNERFFYFVAKFEMNFVDTAGKAACLSTVQIDVENTERFDIRYVDSTGERRRPLLLHTSVSGSLDRNLYAILETQAQRIADGVKPTWPVWLAPIQARVIPVASTHVEGASALACQLPARVDVDDRDEKLGKKIRDAETEWIPYIVVVGDQELGGGALTVRVRGSDQITLAVDEFVALLGAATSGKPFRPSNTPRELTRRPIFTG